MDAYEMQELEPRRLLSAARPSTADRQEILANWGASNAHYLASLLSRGYTAAFDQTLLTYMQDRDGPKYFFQSSDVPSDIAFVQSNLPQQVATAISGADQTVAHLFPLQVNSSSNTVQLGSDISWTTLPKGVASENFLHGMNQMNFWTGLALAYRLTGDAKYSNELNAELQSWTRDNPPLANPDSWTSTEPRWWLLDAAARVDTWIWTYQMMIGTAGWTPAENTLFLHEMMLHGQFLNGATPQSLTSNQTVQHGRALMEVGLMFPEFTQAAGWQSKGLNLIYQCMGTQLYSDGGQAEETPGYQGNVLTNLLDPFLLSSLNNIPWRKAQYRQLLATANSLYQLLQPDGTEPALSDTYRSSGLSIINSASLELGTPGTVFTRARIRDVFKLGQAVAQQTFAVTGNEDLALRGLDYAMPVSGYWISRSGEDRQARQVILDAGPTGGGTHGHLDLLNFELYGYGKPLIADPGPYQLDGSASRKYAVSTPAHNTISVDGVSHAEEDGAGNKAVVFDGETTTNDAITWTAHHFAYANLSGAPVVGRTVWFNRDDTMLVVDFGSSSKSHTYTSGFNLPGTASYVQNNSIRTLNDAGNVMIATILQPGQTTARVKSFISSNPPPDEVSPATHYSVSQAGTSALIANLVVTYAGSTPPNVTATWVTLPKGSRAGVIRITRDGVSQLVSIPVPAMASHTSGVVTAAVARPQVKSVFSTTAHVSWLADSNNEPEA